MNDSVQIFLEFALTHNVVFILMFGVLMPIAAELTVKRSLTAGLKHALVLALAGMAGTALFSLLPADSAFLSPVAIMVVSVAAVAALHRWGELEGEWAGIPRSLLAVAPIAGLQMYLWTEGISGLDTVLASFGAAVGYYLGIVIMVATIEQIRIAEAPAYAKRIGTLFFAIAVFALGFTGFVFL